MSFNQVRIYLTTILCYTATQHLSAQFIEKPYGVKPYKSKYYIVYTDMPPREAKTYAQHMDKLYQEIATRFKGFKQNYQWQRLLFIFKDVKGYQRFLNVNQINIQNTGGLFFARGQELAVVTFVGDRTKTEVLGVLQHEGFHQFAAYFFVNRLPISINEGLAEYFQDAIPYHNRLHLGVADSRRLNSVKQDLRQNNLLGVDQLLTITPKQWSEILSTDARASHKLYNQSWALVYFLIKSDRKVFYQFAKYLNVINSGQNAHTALQAVFPDTNALDRKWRAYLEKLQPNPLMETIYKMEFLAQGLLWLKEHNQPMPANMDQLKAKLQEKAFRIKRYVGVSFFTYDSRDNANFIYQSRDGDTALVLKPSKKKNAMPTITAPLMKPRPELYWAVSKDTVTSEIRLK